MNPYQSPVIPSDAEKTKTSLVWIVIVGVLLCLLARAEYDLWQYRTTYGQLQSEGEELAPIKKR